MMPSDNPESSPRGPDRTGWRRKAGTPSGPARSGKRKAAGWATKQGVDEEKASIRHGARLAVWLLLFVAMVAGFVVWLVWTPLRTPLVVAVVTTCEAPVPPNAWAKEDFERLEALDRQEVLSCSPVAWESKELGVARLRQQIEATAPGGPDRNLIVVYLSMPGAVDGDAEPCFIPPGASAWKSDEWLRVRDLLAQMFPKDGPGKIVRAKKLLVLDATRGDADGNLGQLYNGFAERLAAVAAESNVPGLAVLNSTGPGQIGWAAPELRGSVFGYFLAQALGGAADVERSGDDDRVISLQELHRYLTTYVDQWVTENRIDRQRPMLIPPDADFPVVFRHSRELTTVSPPSPPDSRWSRVVALWERHSQLAREFSYRTRPVAWAEFEQGLLRLDQLIAAGAAYEDEFSDLRKHVESLAASLARDPLAADVAAQSFPLARQYRAWPTLADIERLPSPWTRRPAEPTPRKEAGEKKPEAKPPALPPARYGYLAAASATWEWLATDASHERAMPEGLALIDRAESRPGVDLVEVQFLRMLARHLDTPLWATSSDAIRRGLSARQWAERAAAPVDPRSVYWVQSQVDQTDESRRRAEDCLFVGSKTALAEADGLSRKILGRKENDGAYGEAVARAARVAAAFNVRDRAWAELPYLTQWILAQPASQASDGELRAAINGVRKLEKRLDELVASGDWPADAASLADRLDIAMTALHRRFERECAELRTAGNDRHSWRRIEVALATPSLTGAERNRLRDKQLSIAQEASASGGRYEAAAAEGGAAAKIDPNARGLARLDGWAEHPLTMLLQPAAESGDAESPNGGLDSGKGGAVQDDLARELRVKQLARQGAEVRRRLEMLPEVVHAGLRETTKSLEAKPAPAASLARAGASRADRTARPVAAFFDARLRAKLGDDPAERLRRLDLAHLMLWQAQRTIDDFWGPASDRDTPYFAQAARQYGDSAEKLWPGLATWRTSLDRAVEAAKVGVQPIVEPKNVYIDAAEGAVHHAFAITVPADTPKGLAATFLQDSAGLVPLLDADREPERRLSVAIAQPGKLSTPEYWIPNDDRLRKAERLDAVALFRGHVRHEEFYVPPATGLDIVYARPDYPRPTIVVRGELRQTSAVMFVLDCSGSMGAQQVVEGKNTTRFELARDTLHAMLRRMVGKPYDVGVMIYGRRVGWNPSNPNELVARDPRDWRRFVPRPPELSNVTPSNDIETVLDIGPFTQAEFDNVSRDFAALHNMGETPLYLAICRAVEALRSEAHLGQRRVVVITDGVNDQSGGGPDIRYLADVEQEFKKPGNEGIRLDVVGFQLRANDKSEADRLDELKRFLADRGFGFYSAQDPSALLQALQRSLALSEYVVESLPSGKRVTPEPLELNMPCPLDRPPAQGAPYRAKLLNPDRSAEAEVTVEGGEGIELFAAEGDRGELRLVHHRYAKNLRDACDKIPAPDDRQNRSFYVAAHLPERKADGMRFYVSIQNADVAQFSPRPHEAWIQIHPVLADSSAPLKGLPFYDMTFVPDCPVPVLTCLAPQWPPGGKEAQIEVWCKLHETPPEVDASVGEFRSRKPTLASVPDARFEIDVVPSRKAGEPLQAIIVERHPAGGDLASVKVEMRPPADKIVRRYNMSSGTIRHTFFYESASAPEVEDYRVQLTSRQKLADGAIATPRPLKVTVPAE